MKKSLLIVLWVVSLFGSSVLAATPISPVVKVRTYDAIQWKYPQELWEWSASIISKWGLLLTNNHVAQNTDEENALWYIICFTITQWSIPECNYTAHVIMRDADLDIAVLGSLFGAVGTAGQRCTTTRRLIIHESVYDTFRDKLVKGINMNAIWSS